MNNLKIKKNDTVVVLSGKDKGQDRQGPRHRPQRGQGRCREGCNMVTCHIKPRRQGEEGGIVKREAAIYACKVQAWSAPSAARPPAWAMRSKDGKKVRVCKQVRRRTVEKGVGKQWLRLKEQYIE